MEAKVLFPKQNKSTHYPEVSFPKRIFVFENMDLCAFSLNFGSDVSELEISSLRSFELT
jgi:hypothetical protein